MPSSTLGNNRSTVRLTFLHSVSFSELILATKATIIALREREDSPGLLLVIQGSHLFKTPTFIISFLPSKNILLLSLPLTHTFLEAETQQETATKSNET